MIEGFEFLEVLGYIVTICEVVNYTRKIGEWCCKKWRRQTDTPTSDTSVDGSNSQNDASPSDPSMETYV